MQRLTVPNVNPLDRASGGRDVARSRRADGYVSDIHTCLDTRGWHYRAHDSARAQPSNDARRFRLLVRKALRIGPAHLPAVPSTCRDGERRHATHR